MKNQKKQHKQPQFNQYWIFGSIVLVFLLLNIFSGAGSQTSLTTTPSKFFEFASNGDVERIEIINKREVFVYLTRDARFKDELKRNSKGTEWVIIDIEFDSKISESRFSKALLRK